MKKLFSRIVCILSILVIMIPFFSLIVSADESTEPTKSKFYNECYQPNESYFDNRMISVSPIATMGFSRERYYGDCFRKTEQGAGKFYFSNYDDMLKNGDSHIYYEFANYSGYKGYYGYKFDFASCLNYLYTHVESSLSYRSDFEDFKGKFLYVYYYELNRADDFSSDFSYKFYFSFSHLHFNTTDPDCIYLESETPIGEASLFIECDGGKIIDRTFSLKDYDSWTNDTKSTLYYKSTDTNYGLPYSIHKGDLNKYNSLNCHFLTAPNVSCTEFTFLEDADNKKIIGINIENDEFSEYGKFSDFVDVKLTPEFNLDMDRVYDENTGAKDYFRFEITNNSDVNIQWLAFIVPENVDTDTVTSSLTDSESITTTKYDYFSSNWMYLIEEDYYLCSLENEEKDSIFGKDKIHQIASKMHGVYYYHMLKAGESYSDIVYWENVKIDPFTKYSIRFYAIPNEYDVVSGINANDYLNLKKTHDTIGVDYDNLNLLNWSYEKGYGKGFLDKESNFIVDDSISKYSLDFNKLQKVYDKTFSVIDIPAFTGVVKGGKGVINGSHDDVIKHLKNYEMKTPTSSNGPTKINKNHVDDPLSDSPDVNLDLDNLSIDNVKSYVKSCSSFFKVLKTALTSFPAFIWVLICFGITALIVIGIVKAIL